MQSYGNIFIWNIYLYFYKLVFNGSIVNVLSLKWLKRNKNKEKKSKLGWSVRCAHPSLNNMFKIKQNMKKEMKMREKEKPTYAFPFSLFYMLI